MMLHEKIYISMQGKDRGHCVGEIHAYIKCIQKALHYTSAYVPWYLISQTKAHRILPHFMSIFFQVLLDSGARPSLEDLEGNTPLHVKCYGETGHESELGAIQLLINNGAKLTARNNRVCEMMTHLLHLGSTEMLRWPFKVFI